MPVRYWKDEPQSEKDEVYKWSRKAKRLKQQYADGLIGQVEYEIKKGVLLNDLEEIERKYE